MLIKQLTLHLMATAFTARFLSEKTPLREHTNYILVHLRIISFICNKTQFFHSKFLQGFIMLFY